MPSLKLAYYVDGWKTNSFPFGKPRPMFRCELYALGRVSFRSRVLDGSLLLEGVIRIAGRNNNQGFQLVSCFFVVKGQRWWCILKSTPVESRCIHLHDSRVLSCEGWRFQKMKWNTEIRKQKNHLLNYPVWGNSICEFSHVCIMIPYIIYIYIYL